MSNVTTGKFLRFEAADSTGVKGSLEVLGIFWVSNPGTNMDIAADDDVIMRDGDNAEMIELRAEAVPSGPAFSAVFPPNAPLKLNGFNVPTLDGGVVYVWLLNPVAGTA